MMKSNNIKKNLVIAFSTLSLSCLVILFAVAFPTLPQPKKTAAEITKAKATRIEDDVVFLTNINPARNYKNPESLNLVANYILTVFQNHCDLARFQTYQTNLLGTEPFEAKNVICQINPDQKSKLVVGAHYDVSGDNPGADDNASGVAGLLELVRLLKNSNLDEVPYQIEVVAYTLEEPPFFKTDQMGSAVHAQGLVDNDIEVIAMLSLEMIGYFSDEPNSQKLISPIMRLWYPTKGNFIGIIGKSNNQLLVSKVKNNFKRANGKDLPVFSLNAPRKLPGIDYSDQLNYWDRGIPAVMISDTSFYRNKNYHKPTDTSDTLDYEKMALVIDGVLEYSLNAK